MMVFDSFVTACTQTKNGDTVSYRTWKMLCLKEVQITHTMRM